VFCAGESSSAGPRMSKYASAGRFAQMTGLVRATRTTTSATTHMRAKKTQKKSTRHPCVCSRSIRTLAYFSSMEIRKKNTSLQTLEMLYNCLLFKNGYFLDNEMRKHGYGVVVMCHALPALTHHVGNEAHDARIFLFLNWRQCRTKMKNYIISHRSKLHDVNTISTDIIQVPPTMSGHSVWEQKMFLSLRKAVCSTFNLQ